jgi:two-component system, OmpR family, manganese sensing sensor histidine kinase
MASGIGLPTSAADTNASPRALERRLFLSYFTAFALTFLVAAFAVRAAFISSLDQEITTRLQVLARAGLRTTVFSDNRLGVDPHDISNASLRIRNSGLQYFDRGRRLLASEGVVPNAGLLALDGPGRVFVDGLAFNTYAIPITNPETHERVGTVRASEGDEARSEDVRLLDRGLLFGTLAAIFGSGLGGFILARRAVRPVVRSFEMLRMFTADASHELRGPLTAIAGNADAALRDPERDPERDRARFEMIADGATQMARLSGDLLLLAGADRSLEREMFVVDLAKAVRKIELAYARRFAAKGVALRVRVRPLIVYGNPDQIERILANLVENALQYTQADGSVTVEVKREHGYALVAVRDTGVGIAQEHIERVFDRFWRASPARPKGGSGLGLAIARALARRHGGDVTVTSRFGDGSEFVSSFPMRPRRID